MNLFEPLFLLLALVTALTLLTAAACAVLGRFARAWRILRRLLIGNVVYFAVVIVVSIGSPRRTYRIGDPQCFDDWCITVVDVNRTKAGAGVDYDVDLQIANRARRMPMGEKDTVVYLSDAQGRRYDPAPDRDALPLDTRLQPGERLTIKRRFHVPDDAQHVGLVYTHEGGFPIGWFIITEGGWFARPPLVRFD